MLPYLDGGGERWGRPLPPGERRRYTPRFRGAGRPPGVTGDVSAAAPIRVLLVEDNADDVDLMRRFLWRVHGNFHVEVAYTGAEALEKARLHPFDVAFVDQNLPDVPGERLITRLREAVPELPAVMLTGHGDERLAVEVMKAGAYDYLRKDDLEPRLLRRTLHNVLERARLEAEVRRANERLREWAIRDGLTGLYNHRHFQERLRTELARAQRYGQPLSCLMLDLDHFKSLNDTYGHPFGDEVLKKVAHTLRDEARQGDVIARYGGEEFVLVLPSTDVAGARAFAERIGERIAAEPVHGDGFSAPVTVSVGVATSTDPRVRSERDLIKLADAALYAAKRLGRNRVCVADDPAVGLSATPTPPAGGIPRAEIRTQVRRLFLDSLRPVVERVEQAGERAGHGARVAALAVRLGRAAGLGPDELEVLENAGRLHDLGHIGISDSILRRPGPLDADERAQVQRHPVAAAELLAQADFLERERIALRHHHERWAGGGFPDGLAGDGIPRTARIIAICDGFAAMTAPRPWRGPLSADDALAALERAAGTVYDPDLTERFFEVVRQVRREEGVRD